MIPRLEEIDRAMARKGMITLTSQMTERQPLDTFMTHTGVQDWASFRSWVEMRLRSYVSLHEGFEREDSYKEELDIWCDAHLDAFKELDFKFKAVTSPDELKGWLYEQGYDWGRKRYAEMLGLIELPLRDREYAVGMYAAFHDAVVNLRAAEMRMGLTMPMPAAELTMH